MLKCTRRDEAGEEVAVGETGTMYFANGHQFSHNDPQSC